MTTVTAFAPATSANLGPGFDLLGVAIEGLGDSVTAWRRKELGVVIESIEGDHGALPLEAEKNTAGIAAIETLRLIAADVGVGLHIHKGLPIGSGLGSSAASAAAAIWAVNALLDKPLGRKELLHAGLVAEASVGGWHADNVAPSLFGGLLLVRSYDPVELIELPTPDHLIFVLTSPHFELRTKLARAALPKSILLKQHIANNGNLAAMIAACFTNSLPLFGRAVQDAIVEPARAHLIPGFVEVKQAALQAGALACSISGGGPTIFAITDNPKQATLIAHAMEDAFERDGKLDSHSHIARVDKQGAKVI